MYHAYSMYNTCLLLLCIVSALLGRHYIQGCVIDNTHSADTQAQYCGLLHVVFSVERPLPTTLRGRWDS